MADKKKQCTYQFQEQAGDGHQEDTDQVHTHHTQHLLHCRGHYPLLAISNTSIGRKFCKKWNHEVAQIKIKNSK